MVSTKRRRWILEPRIVVMALLFVIPPIGPAAQEKYADMALEDLLNVEVIEAITKRPEVLFEAPLDVSVLRREQIVKSGATSIPEALELLPGIIVREQTPGNYDVHIRGFDNATVNSMLPFPSNSITLVMIDYRIVYNYFASGTFWETLPIELHDIERIEVIRGASSSLYGPNAVAGVINIVTERPEQEGLYANVYSQAGTNTTCLAGAALGFNLGENVDAVFSGNYGMRERHESLYYEWASASPVSVDSLHSMPAPDDIVSNWKERYPDPEQALLKYGMNASVRFNVSNQSHIVVAGGRQESEVQKVYVNNLITPLSTNTSTTNYADIKVTMEANTRLQLSYLDGRQGVEGMGDWQYEMNVFEAGVEHDFAFGKLDLRPAVTYRVANYDGRFIGGSRNIVNEAASLLADFRPWDELRLLGAGRLDHYQHTGGFVPSCQAAATYMFNVKNMLRVAAYHANKAPSMLETHISHSLPLELATVEYRGNTDLLPLTMNTYELGWRTKAIPGFEMSIDGFVSQLDDFADLLYSSTRSDSAALIIEYEYTNHDLEARQFGGTISLTHSFRNMLTARLHATVQHTDYPEETQSRLRGELDTDIMTTPVVFGGFCVDFSPWERLNLNVNGTFATEQQFKGVLGVDDIGGHVDLNGKLGFRIWRELWAFASVRNALSSGRREYGFADAIARTFLFGVRYEH